MFLLLLLLLLSTTTQAIIISECPADSSSCQHFLTNECVTSKFGVRCAECNGNGYLVPTRDLQATECSCYSKSLDPKRLCQPPLLFAESSELFQVERTFTKISCEAFQSEFLGCFDQTDDSEHKYGTPDPPVPYRCCIEELGPPPGELREIFTLGKPHEECNTPGGPNLNLVNDTSFRTCSGHGNYNFTSRLCECYSKWQLGFLATNPLDDTKDLYSCLSCAPHFGPSPYDILASPPFCDAIYSSDPVTGVWSECGGKGLYSENEGCTCYSNATVGFWKLERIGGMFDLHGNEQFAETCASCQYGYSLPTCL